MTKNLAAGVQTIIEAVGWLAPWAAA